MLKVSKFDSSSVLMVEKPKCATDLLKFFAQFLRNILQYVIRIVVQVCLGSSLLLCFRYFRLKDNVDVLRSVFVSFH